MFHDTDSVTTLFIRNVPHWHSYCSLFLSVFKNRSALSLWRLALQVCRCQIFLEHVVLVMETRELCAPGRSASGPFWQAGCPQWVIWEKRIGGRSLQSRFMISEELLCLSKLSEEESALTEGISTYHVSFEPGSFGDTYSCLCFKDEETEGQWGYIVWSSSQRCMWWSWHLPLPSLSKRPKSLDQVCLKLKTMNLRALTHGLLTASCVQSPRKQHWTTSSVWGGKTWTGIQTRSRPLFLMSQANLSLKGTALKGKGIELVFFSAT